MPTTLTVLEVRRAKPAEKQYALTDGNGLQLTVFPNGRKAWQWRYYRPNGKRNMLGLGRFPEVSLSDAREYVFEARKLLRRGIDPAEQRKEEKRTQLFNESHTFKALAREWHDNASKRWKPTSNRTRLSWAALEQHVFPHVGNRPIDSIKPLEWLEVIKRLEAAGKHEQKRRVHAFCRDIYRLAVVTDRASGNPLADLGVALERATTKRHFPHVSQAELPALIRALANYDGNPLVTRALRLLFLTAVRPGELRLAKWEEFDLGNKLWRIPAERMKMARAHQVPLPRQAVKLLHELHDMTGSYPLLFPGRNDTRKPMSDMTMSMAYKRLGYAGRHVPHGTRHVVATGLKERGYPREWIETQLSHKLPGIEGVYTHAEHMAPEQRPKMMQEWADTLDRFL
ncbi:tyrosine-type recombinase/integrase [Halotalea alkalilenta]|uniref:tyrosine-type recombinase/integrase n=1 Tax=Halotalea alkalilenta TaxID=376489 RepID=UPI0005BBC5F1|nr:integrase arm-type DNA-binding domain-containing protein [Halotalea alkalilenta]